MKQNPDKLHHKIFNLLKPELPPPTAWDKIYDWLATRARIVVVICEILVVICFIGKVVVDIQSKDINEALDAKSRDLASFFGTIEPKLRKIQQKSRNYERIWEGSNKYNEVLNEILSYIPNPGINITINMSGETVTIRGDDELSALQTIEAKMKVSPNFKEVQLELNTEGNQQGLPVGSYIISALVADLNSRESLKTVQDQSQNGQTTTSETPDFTVESSNGNP